MQPETILESKSIRCTPIRQAILEILLKKGCPMSYKEVEAFLPEESDRVTIYRTLLLLFRKGIVHRVMDMKGTWRFCAHDPGISGCPGDHAHFECLICGRMDCLTNTCLPYIDVEDGAVVKGKHMVVYGVCPLCMK